MVESNLNPISAQAKHKLVFLGDIYVGKTSIINRFTENKFNETYDVTIKIKIT